MNFFPAIFLISGLIYDAEASLKLDCDVDSCVSCTILNFKKEEYDEGLALFCDKILGCCFDTFGDKLDNVIGDYESLKRKELTPEMKKYLHQKMKGPSEKVIEVKQDQDGNMIYGVYSEDVDEEEHNKFKLGAKHVDEL